MNLAVNLIADFIGPSLYAKAVSLLSLVFIRGFLVNLSLFSRQPNYRLSKSVTLVKAVSLFKPCIY